VSNDIGPVAINSTQWQREREKSAKMHVLVFMWPRRCNRSDEMSRARLIATHLSSAMSMRDSQASVNMTRQHPRRSLLIHHQ